jgi:hypothetical protein
VNVMRLHNWLRWQMVVIVLLAGCQSQKPDVADPQLTLVASWLRERVTIDEARNRVAHHWDLMIRSAAESAAPQSAQPAPDRAKALESQRRQGQAALKQLEAMLDRMQPGDEIWWYNSPPERWAGHAGENGLAIVRAGRVIRKLPIIVN